MFEQVGASRPWSRAQKVLLSLAVLLVVGIGLAANAALGPYVGAKSGPGVESCNACGQERHLYNPTNTSVRVVVKESRRHPGDKSWNYDKEHTYTLGPQGSRFLGCDKRAPAPSSVCILTFQWTVKSWKKVGK